MQRTHFGGRIGETTAMIARRDAHNTFAPLLWRESQIALVAPRFKARLLQVPALTNILTCV